MRTPADLCGNDAERGQAGLFMVLTLTLLLGTLGLAVDVGTAYYTKQSAQAAADAAAMAAASYASDSIVACGGSTICNSTATSCANPPTSPPTTNLQAGCLYAQTNGFVNNGTSQFVSLAANTTAPPGVSGNTPTYWVQANVTAKPFTLFGNFGNMPQFTIHASSIAAVEYLSAGACIYVLDASANNAFSTSGNANVNATCGIFVNSSSASAFTVVGNGNVTASQILVNGGTSIAGNATVSPTPKTNQGTQSDPFSSVPNPTFTDQTCDAAHTGVSITGTQTLSQGTYCGGISISSPSANVTFSPGTYVIKGGLSISGGTTTFGAGMYIINGTGFSVTGQANVSGTFVTVFNTGQYAGNTVGPINIAGQGTINLEAPDSGTYQGMLFMQDRTLTYIGQNSFAGGSSTIIKGSLYFPTTTVSYSGGSSSGSYTAIVAKKASFSGNAYFKNDPTGIYTGLSTTVRGLIQ